MSTHCGMTKHQFDAYTEEYFKKHSVMSSLVLDYKYRRGLTADPKILQRVWELLEIKSTEEI